MDRDETVEIARREADDTFQSITDLDGICDTNLIAITFLLTALSAWTSFSYDRIVGSGPLGPIYLSLVVLCAICIFGSVVFHINALTPRAFYGPKVGKRFLDHPWAIWRNDDALNTAYYESEYAALETTDEYEERVQDWLAEEYSVGEPITSRDEFEIARLLNYKAAARIKAKHTAYGVSLLRLSVLLLVLLIALSVVGPFLL